MGEVAAVESLLKRGNSGGGDSDFDNDCAAEAGLDSLNGSCEEGVSRRFLLKENEGREYALSIIGGLVDDIADDK